MTGIAAPNGHRAGYHFDELWRGSLSDLRSLLAAGYFGEYQDAPLEHGGGLYMECPLAPGGAHFVHALERRADDVEFACSSHDCEEDAIRARVHNAQALADDQPEPAGAEPESSWLPVNLLAILEAGATEEPPTMLSREDGPCLVYPGKSHALFGEPESGKGWLGLHAAQERLAAGERVLYFDFEDTAATVVGRLLALGVAPHVITERFHYVRPDEALDAAGQAALEGLLSLGPTLAVIDGVTEALTLHGLELKDNGDIARWLKLLPRRLTDAGAAVIQIDHVSKDKDARGRFAIGAQHKLAGIDVAYTLEVLEPFGRGREGRVRVLVTKDRPGHIRQHSDANGRVAELKLRSAGRDGVVSITLAPPASTGSSPFRPTGIMERISRAVEDTPGLSITAIRGAVKGRNEHKDLALELLINDGHIEARREGQAVRHHSVRSYREVDE